MFRPDDDEVLRGLQPTIDPVEMSVSRARVAGAIFSTPSAAPQIGRFNLLERLGAGGVGIVYTAYDPQLDRAVALKLVRVRETGQSAALAEAKALARLAHPNVVPVHDVGIIGEHVFIVMELVRGKTLSAWTTQAGRTRRQVIDAYLQAAHALSAAHAVGLVHRDFKPENVIVGDDGRVRVVDFGLACEAGESTSRGAGTPAYMAPEQAAGLAPTPAADQFSFGTSMLEALSTLGTLPRWLEVTLGRARTKDPAARYASMGELAAALSRDPIRARWRNAALAGITVAIAAAFFVGRSLSTADGPCTGAPDAMQSVWGSEGRGPTLARLSAFGEYGKVTAAQLDRQIAQREAAWISTHREACLTHQRAEQSDALFDRRVACLGRARVALVTLAETIKTATASSLPNLASAQVSLLDPAGCTGLEPAPSEVEPPSAAIAASVAALRSKLARGRVLLAAARYEDAKAELLADVLEARAVGYVPALAEALLLQGEVIYDLNRADSLPALTEALNLALKSGANRIATRAWAVRAYATATDVDPNLAMAGFELIEPIATRDPAPSFARVLLYNSVGGHGLASANLTGARVAFQRALKESQGLQGHEAALAIKVRTSLAMTLEGSARDDMLAEAIAEQQQLLGPDHPRTLMAQVTRGIYTEDLRTALGLLKPPCQRLELLHPLLRGGSDCWIEVSFDHELLGEHDLAIEAMGHALRAKDPQRLNDGIPSGYLAMWSDKPGDASAAFSRYLAENLPKENEPWWSSMDLGVHELGLGQALQASSAAAEAIVHYRKAVAHLAAATKLFPKPLMQRKLARAEAALALALALARKDPMQASALASQALPVFRAMGADPVQIKALEKLLREEAPRPAGATAPASRRCPSAGGSTVD